MISRSLRSLCARLQSWPHGPELILVSLSLCCWALIYRSRQPLYGSLHWHFLIWNLWLAIIPYGLSLLMLHLSVAKRWLVAIPWLLFFPNAPYVLTDLIHLHRKATPHLWHDLATLLSAALTAQLIGGLSLRHVQHLASTRWGTARGWLLVVAVSFASGFGIYLGRFLRLNSWDILRPWRLLSKTLDIFSNPNQLKLALATTLICAALILLTHAALSLNDRRVRDGA